MLSVLIIVLICGTAPASSAGQLLKLAVQCSARQRCSVDIPICCGPDEGYTSPYCQRSGSFCCDAKRGRDYGGCPIGTSCCLGANNSGVKACCQAGSTCSPQGTCVPDSCQSINSQAICEKVSMSGFCKWCCNGQCMTATSYDYGCKVAASECATQCTMERTCGGCVKTPNCQWCCSTATCEHKLTAKCGARSFLTGALDSPNCTVCERGGQGIYHILMENEDTLSDDIYTFSLYLAGCLISIMIICFATRAIQNFIRRRNAPLPIVIGSRGGDREMFNYMPVSKVRFFDLTEVLPEGMAAPAEGTVTVEEQCVICLETASQVVFLPCHHMCCCCQCSFQWEDTHVAAEKALYESGLPSRGAILRCPLCRVGIESMIRAK